jgi:hypothetical protein
MSQYIVRQGASHMAIEGLIKAEVPIGYELFSLTVSYA